MGFLNEIRPESLGRWFPRAVSAECRDFVCSLLKVNWMDRISASEALKHPWIRRVV